MVRLATSLSIVVVSHDSGSELALLIDSIRRELGADPQIVVVDTGSTDASLAVARCAGAEVVALSDNPGFGPANNAGLERARGQVTALLNPDIELLDGGLERLVGLAVQQPALLVPRLVGHDGSVQKTAHPVPGRPGGFAFALLGARAAQPAAPPGRTLA